MAAIGNKPTRPEPRTVDEACLKAALEKQTAKLTALRALNAELVGDIQALIKCVPDQNWNQMEDREAFYEVAEKYKPSPKETSHE